MSRERLDVALVARGLMPSRARAADAIRRGEVTVGGRTELKPGALVGADAAIDVADPAGAYVSRSALKLAGALDTFALSPAGLDCLDVGHGQLAPAIAADRRVTAIEGLNARDLTADHLARPPGFVVADVSFISLTLALPPALALAAPGATGVFLVKPQFEVGRDGIGKGGIVRDPALALAAIDRIAAFVEGEGWRVIGRTAAAIAGGDGNQEHLIAARKPDRSI